MSFFFRLRSERKQHSFGSRRCSSLLPAYLQRRGGLLLKATVAEALATASFNRAAVLALRAWLIVAPNKTQPQDSFLPLSYFYGNRRWGCRNKTKENQKGKAE